MKTVTISIVEKRLMGLPEAARYLNMTPKQFRAVCSVNSYEVGLPKPQYDRADLDAWLEARKSEGQATRAEQLLERL